MWGSVREPWQAFGTILVPEGGPNTLSRRAAPIPGHGVPLGEPLDQPLPFPASLPVPVLGLTTSLSLSQAPYLPPNPRNSLSLPH